MNIKVKNEMKMEGTKREDFYALATKGEARSCEMSRFGFVVPWVSLGYVRMIQRYNLCARLTPLPATAAPEDPLLTGGQR